MHHPVRVNGTDVPIHPQSTSCASLPAAAIVAATRWPAQENNVAAVDWVVNLAGVHSCGIHRYFT
jgi:hypothetical protein